MKLIPAILSLVLLACFIPGIAFPADISALEILAAADQKIIPDVASYLADIKVEAGSQVRKYSFKGSKKGQEKNLLIQTEPKSAIGICHLRKGESIWTYYPTIHKTMRYAYMSIFLDSTLNYGDMMNTELTRDYDPVSLETEKAEGRDAYKITMTPKKGHEGYARIVSSIDRESYLPIKREYYALSGVLMKTAVFQKFDFSAEGRVVNAVLYFYEPLKKQSTTVTYRGIQEKAEIEDNLFNPNNLRYISGR